MLESLLLAVLDDAVYVLNLEDTMASSNTYVHIENQPTNE